MIAIPSPAAPATPATPLNPSSRVAAVSQRRSGAGPLPARRLAPEVYRARRLAALLVVFALAVGSVLAVASMGNQAAASRGGRADPSNSVEIMVMPGDTLWGIAERLDPGADPRPLVHELTSLAGKGVLQPGQVLVIPNSLVG